MSLPHYFLEEQILSTQTAPRFALLLSDEDLKHARVARLSAGEHVAVVDASNDYFECEVVSFDGAYPEVRIAQKLEGSKDKPRITLAQGLAKGEKMELVFRHATEVGVASFTPLACSRSIVKLDAKKADSRVKRWNAITKSAAMQSGQTAIPVVAEPLSVQAFANTLDEYDTVLICWEEAPTSKTLKGALNELKERLGNKANTCSIAVVVGPEGGLAEKEVNLFLSMHPHASLVSLGSSILRTETAGIVAPSLILYELGQLGGQAE